MTKKSILIFMIFLICTAAISISFAFIIRETTSNNIITFGNLKMEMIVTSMENNKERKVSDGQHVNVTFDSFVNRNVEIKNICNHPLYVRVAFDLIGKTYENNEIEDYSNIKFEHMDNNWIYKDGWYYYKDKIDKKKTSDKLIVNFDFDIDEILDKYSKSSYELKIKAEAVQYENNKESVLDAVGWPS